MHELSIALSILDCAEEELQCHVGGKVIAIHLKLGPLSGVVREALVSAFELACEGSSLDHPELVIQEMPVVVFCAACRCERTVISIQRMCCSHCQTPTPEIVRGRELEITALEIES